MQQTMLSPEPEPRAYFSQPILDTAPLTATRVATIDDRVRYVLDEGRSRGQIRPATVVRTWSAQPGAAINLQVDIDGSNDYPTGSIAAMTGRIWRTSVPYSASMEPGTWHWPTTETTTTAQTIIDATL